MSKPADHSIDTRSARIMIVDDQPANVLLLEKTLRSRGYQTLEGFTDPRQAVARYAEARPDLLLLDLNMPHLDGFAVMEKLHELPVDLHPPVLVITAQHDLDSRLRALQAGARDFLTKPFDVLEALARISNLIEVHLLQKAMRDQNALLETKVLERTRELNETRLEVVRRLGRAAEYRDNETGFHIIRMSQFSARLAAAAGWNPAQVEKMLHASPMHDIGKIGIPDRILLKPGKLEGEEWETMMTHTTIGAEILSGHDSELMRLAAEIALSHHEKWDGSGYPRGLAGTDIPEAGRIVALCDVFDALTSERPYKKAWSIEDTVAHLRAQSGLHFDPAMVELFMDLLPEILTIRARHAEPQD